MPSTKSEKTESQRLAALAAYQVLDTLPEQSFDDITMLASQICETPIAMVAFVDETRVWAKSVRGMENKQVPRQHSFCHHVIKENEFFVVENAMTDNRVKGNPTVTGAPHLRFCAAAPLTTPEGYNIGALCVLDRQPKKINSGQISCLQALARKVVTELERKMAFNELNKAKKSLDEAQILSNSGSWEWDFFSDKISWSAGEYLLFRRDLSFPLSSDTYFSHFSPKQAEKVRAAIANAMHGDGRYFVEVDITRGDGVSRTIRDTGHLEFVEKGKPKRMFGFTQDITESRAVAEELVASRQLIAQTLKTLPVMVFAKDVKNDFRFTIWNDTAEKILGLKASECLGKSDYELFPKAQADFFRARDLDTIKKAGVLETDEEFVDTPSGRVTLRTKKVVLHNSRREPTYLLGVSEDISKAKEAERVIKEQQAKLLSSGKLSALGEMAGGIAHEINSPLAIINGKAELLKKEAREGKFEKERFVNELGKIEFTVERIAKIIRGLRSFSRNSEFDPLTPTSLENIITDTLELCRERLRGLGIELRLSPTAAIEISCRAPQISQILMNLVNNASDAIEALDEKWIEIKVECSADKALIFVTDSGNGIPSEIAEQMMVPFFTTKDVGKGTGLGLSISKGLAEDNGGSLHYAEKHPHTCFVVEIPLYLGSSQLKAA